MPAIAIKEETLARLKHSDPQMWQQIMDVAVIEDGKARLQADDMSRIVGQAAIQAARGRQASKKSTAAPPPPSTGPGTQLKQLLARLGIHASPTCKCNSMARKMDEWGPDESLAHVEEIVDVMEETAKARGLPFLRAAGRLLVKRAIHNARKQQKPAIDA